MPSPQGICQRVSDVNSEARLLELFRVAVKIKGVTIWKAYQVFNIVTGALYMLCDEYRNAIRPMSF